MPRIESGFTLVELMVAVAVLAILIMLTVNLGSLFVNNRRAAAVNDVLAAMNYARFQAISRGTSVTICRSANPEAATPVCGGGAGWESGWIVFTDRTNPGVADADELPALQVHESLPNGFTLRGDGTVIDRITFSPLGTNIGFTGAITLCDQRGFGADARIIEVGVGGRIRSVVPAGAGTCT
jgi:type IV fimbrial biogenesis protein FimT